MLENVRKRKLLFTLKFPISNVYLLNNFYKEKRISKGRGRKNRFSLKCWLINFLLLDLQPQSNCPFMCSYVFLFATLSRHKS